MLLGFTYGREKRFLLDIRWIIHSAQDQASLLDNKMPCMSNWWANGCPAEHSKLTAKSTIRFLSPFSSKHASLPGPLPVCANTYVAFESNCGARGREAPVLLQHGAACWSFPEGRKAVNGSTEQQHALTGCWQLQDPFFCNQRPILSVWLLLCDSLPQQLRTAKCLLICVWSFFLFYLQSRDAVYY